MRAFAQKQNQSQKREHSGVARSHCTTPELNRCTNSIPNLQRALNSYAFEPLLQTNAEEFEVEAAGTASPRVSHSFDKIPLYHSAASAIQAKSALHRPIYMPRNASVNSVVDPFESEANEMAASIAGIADPSPTSAAPGSPAPDEADVGAALRSLSGGAPLQAAVRREFEGLLGAEFARVRVHTEPAAWRAARRVDAVAFTHREHVVFDSGRYDPSSRAGRHLLAHELTHVIQQGAAQPRTRPAGQAVARAELAWTPTRSVAPGSVRDRTLQRAPVTEKRRSFTPTKFTNLRTLIAVVVSDGPKQEDLVGACRYLDALPMAEMLALAQRIAEHKPAAVATLEATARQGWATSRARAALAAVKLKGKISRVGFAAEQASDVEPLEAGDARQVLDVLGSRVPELETMQSSKGFQALRADERARLSYLIGGSTSLSAQAPAMMRTLLSDRRVNKDDPATFRKFLTEEKYLQWDVRLPPRGDLRPRDKFTVGSAVDVPNYAFGGLSSLAADALRYDVVIDVKDQTGKPVTQTIPVFLPKSAGLKDRRFKRPTINEIAETLAATPDVSRSKIVRVDVHWMTFTQGTGKPDDTRETSAAAGADGVVNMYPIKNTENYRAGLNVDVTHETGHTASIAAWGPDTDDDKWKPWRSAMQSDGMAVSQYAKTTIFEDFAESWALYAPVIGTPREAEVRAIIPARCKLMDTLLWQKPTGARP